MFGLRYMFGYYLLINLSQNVVECFSINRDRKWIENFIIKNFFILRRIFFVTFFLAVEGQILNYITGNFELLIQILKSTCKKNRK